VAVFGPRRAAPRPPPYSFSTFPDISGHRPQMNSLARSPISIRVLEVAAPPRCAPGLRGMGGRGLGPTGGGAERWRGTALREATGCHSKSDGRFGGRRTPRLFGTGGRWWFVSTGACWGPMADRCFSRNVSSWSMASGMARTTGGILAVEPVGPEELE